MKQPTQKAAPRSAQSSGSVDRGAGLRLCVVCFRPLKPHQPKCCGKRCAGMFSGRLAASRREPARVRFWKKVNKTAGGCWEWTAASDRLGYGRFGDDSKVHLAHRYSWYLTHGEWPEDCLLHKCDNPSCVNPEHLFEGSREDNVADMLSKGRQNYVTRRGEAHGNAKLTASAVREMRQRASSGETQRSIAKSFGVARSTVGLILKGKSWAHVD